MGYTWRFQYVLMGKPPDGALLCFWTISDLRLTWQTRRSQPRRVGRPQPVRFLKDPKVWTSPWSHFWHFLTCVDLFWYFDVFFCVYTFKLFWTCLDCLYSDLVYTLVFTKCSTHFALSPGLQQPSCTNHCPPSHGGVPRPRQCHDGLLWREGFAAPIIHVYHVCKIL